VYFFGPDFADTFTSVAERIVLGAGS